MLMGILGLKEKLKHTPGDLNKMFFTICGSTAVETAIKIARSVF